MNFFLSDINLSSRMLHCITCCDICFNVKFMVEINLSVYINYVNFPFFINTFLGPVNFPFFSWFITFQNELCHLKFSFIKFIRADWPSNWELWYFTINLEFEPYYFCIEQISHTSLEILLNCNPLHFCMKITLHPINWVNGHRIGIFSQNILS